MNTLITGAASTKAHQLKNKLNSANIILGDYAELPSLMLKAGSMILLPDPADASYAHKMLTLCLDRQIITVYALQPDEFIQLSEAAVLFAEYEIQILPSPDEIR